MKSTEIHLRLLAEPCSATHMLDDLRVSASPEVTLSLLNHQAAAAHAA